MRNCLVLFLLFLISTSCATLLNERNRKIRVYTEDPATITIGEQTQSTSKKKAVFTVPRSADTLEVLVQTAVDSSTIYVPSSNSFGYYLNIPYNLGLGILIDQDNPKRFTYPGELFIGSMANKKQYASLRQASNQGSFYVTLSLPYVNQFHFQPPDRFRTEKHAGFFGLGAGLAYQHGRTQRLELAVRAATNFFIPFPVPITFDSEYETVNTTFVSLTNHHLLNRWSIGYGLTFSENQWNLFDSLDEDFPGDVRIQSNALGFLFPVYYQLGTYFDMGVLYRPSFLQLGTSSYWKYEHYIGLDLSWRIRL